MPVYNCESYVGTAIESILGQTFKDFELLVIDDGSSDSSADIAESFADNRIKVVRNDKNRGIAYALNEGIAHSTGEYIARMDSDDIARNDRLEKQVHILDQTSMPSLCHSNYREIDKDGIPIVDCAQNHRGLPTEWLLLWGNPIAHPSIMFSREALQRANAQYISASEPAEDYDLWTRLFRKVAFQYSCEPLLSYRRHMGSVFERNSQESLSKCIHFNERLVNGLTSRQVPLYHRYLTSFGGVLKSKMEKTSVAVLEKWFHSLARLLAGELGWDAGINDEVTLDIQRRIRGLLYVEKNVYYAKGTRNTLLRRRPVLLLQMETSWQLRRLRRILKTLLLGP
jgi:glycosyltransferase involved in cell wall biosynthesis